MRAGTTTIRDESAKSPDSFTEMIKVHCQDCRWRGVLADLLVADDKENDMLYFPKCKNYSWVYS